MPGPAHFIYGFTIGLILVWFSRRTNLILSNPTDSEEFVEFGGKIHGSRFTTRHAFVYGWNTYMGPDIGVILWWITRFMGYGDTYRWQILWVIHDPFHFMIFIAPVLAIFWREFSRLDVARSERGWPKIIKKEKPELSYLQNLELIIAGGFSHFAYDYIFENNGHGPIYRWVIDSGSWDDPHFDVWVVVVVILFTGFILGWIALNNTAFGGNYSQQLKRTAALLILITSVYLVYLGWRLNLGLDAVAQEADFGVIIFSFFYYFLPLILCGFSMDSAYVFKYRAKDGVIVKELLKTDIKKARK